MSIFSRIKRLWEISGSISDTEDEQQAHQMKKSFTVKRKKADQKLATIVFDDPLNIFPSEEEPENNNDTTN